MKTSKLTVKIHVDTEPIEKELQKLDDTCKNIMDERRKALDGRIAKILSDFFQEEITVKNAEETFKRLDDMGLELFVEIDPPLFARTSVQAGVISYKATMDTKIYIRVKKEDPDHER